MTNAEEIWTPPDVIEHQHAGPCACEPTVVYVRVSRVGDRKYLVSPDIQFDAGLADARKKNKRVVEVITDINRSGRTFVKRSVDRAIKMIEDGKARSITVWKWSRWGRNLELSLAYLSKVKAVGGRVDSATEDIDQKTASGRLSRDLTMRFDQFLSELIGEGWQDVHQQRRNAKLPINGRPRFGYVSVTKKKILNALEFNLGEVHVGGSTCSSCLAKEAHFIIHEVEGPVLCECYRRYNSGVGFNTLCDDLNTAGFRTTMHGLWTPQGLSQMMDTGFAAGWLRERSEEIKERTRASKKQLRNSIRNFDIWRPGCQPTLIDEDTWQDYKERRFAQSDLPPRLRNAAHPLSALLFCELCARRLSTKYSGALRQHSWVCKWHKPFHPDKYVSIGNTTVMDIVRRWVQDNAAPLADLELVDQLAKQDYESAGAAGRALTEIRHDINSELKAVDNLIQMCARGVITEDQLATNRVEFEDNLSRLRAEEALLVQTAAGPDGRPPYAAFGALDEVWAEALAGDPSSLNGPLTKLIGFVIVGPANGRNRWHDSSSRVETVGRWETSSKERWLRARRRRFAV